MKIKTWLRRATVPAALSLLSAPVLAQSVSHEASGLGVSPPAGYTANEMPARGKNAVVYAVKKPDDKDTGCQIGFAEATQNAGLSQDKINEMMKTAEHQDLARTSISSLYETRSVEAFDNGAGVTGIEMVSDIKPRDGFPPRSQEIRNMMILLENSRGRVSVVCVADKSNFDERRNEFHALARGVTLPK